jgi:addiction module HigA family antidote
MNDWKEPIHPGEILADELDFLGISIEQLAKYIKVSENNIEQILKGQVNLTADIALRLGYFFNTGAEMWMNLQKAYELDVARQQLGDKLELIVPWRSLSSTSEELTISA